MGIINIGNMEFTPDDLEYIRDELAAEADAAGYSYPEDTLEDDVDFLDIPDAEEFDEDNISIDEELNAKTRDRQQRRKLSFKSEQRRQNIVKKHGFVSGLWIKKKNESLVRRKRNSEYESFCKRLSNKRWRKMPPEFVIGNPSEYRKVFDYALWLD